MELIKMRPAQLRDAVARNVPVLIPFGATEYHGEHLPLGTDTLIAEGLCRMIEQRAEVVIAPSLPFAPTMHWAGAPTDGDVDFPQEAMMPYVYGMLDSLLAMGFRRIYVVIGHQGVNGMPATIARAAAHRIQQEWSKQFPAGWGRAIEQPVRGFFDMINICAYDQYVDYSQVKGEKPMPIGHAGRGETQLILAMEEGLADLSAASANPKAAWLDDLSQADKANGEYWLRVCADAWINHLNDEARRFSA